MIFCVGRRQLPQGCGQIGARSMVRAVEAAFAAIPIISILQTATTQGCLRCEGWGLEKGREPGLYDGEEPSIYFGRCSWMEELKIRLITGW